MKKLTWIIIGSIVFLGLIVLIIGITTSNKEIGLVNQAQAQKEVVESYFDKMWKVIQQKAQIADQYKTSFKDIYIGIMEGRYGSEKGGSLMKFVKEANPNFDVSLYRDLAQSVEAERTGFFHQQETLIDIAREHRNLKQQFPGSLFVGDRPDIKYTIISSTTTKQIITTGKEDDIDLFKK